MRNVFHNSVLSRDVDLPWASVGLAFLLGLTGLAGALLAVAAGAGWPWAALIYLATPPAGIAVLTLAESFGERPGTWRPVPAGGRSDE